MSEQLATIKASEWNTIVEDVKAGRCEVYNFRSGYLVEYIQPLLSGSNCRVKYIGSDIKASFGSDYEFGVHWFDTPGHPDTQAVLEDMSDPDYGVPEYLRSVIADALEQFDNGNPNAAAEILRQAIE